MQWILIAFLGVCGLLGAIDSKEQKPHLVDGMDQRVIPKIICDKNITEIEYRTYPENNPVCHISVTECDGKWFSHCYCSKGNSSCLRIEIKYPNDSLKEILKSNGDVIDPSSLNTKSGGGYIPDNCSDAIDNKSNHTVCIVLIIIGSVVIVVLCGILIVLFCSLCKRPFFSSQCNERFRTEKAIQQKNQGSPQNDDWRENDVEKQNISVLNESNEPATEQSSPVEVNDENRPIQEQSSAFETFNLILSLINPNT